jgi:glutathione S-transferase
MTSTNTETSSKDNDNDKTMIIYAIMGSQYVFKVLAALQQEANATKNKDLKYHVHLVPTDEAERAKTIPSGGLLVPELQVGLDKETRTIVSGSEAILHYLSDHNMVTGLYPNELASQVSERASDGILAIMVWYYNWVEPNGHAASLRRQIGEKVVPWFVPMFLVDFKLQSIRTKYTEKVQSELPPDAAADIKDEPAMRQRLVEELEYFNSLLQSDDQAFLIPESTVPSAADFSTYCLLERLVGDVDDSPSSDYPIYPAIPELKTEETSTSLKRLWKWHDRMRTTYKVQFKGRRVPKDVLLSQL